MVSDAARARTRLHRAAKAGEVLDVTEEPAREVPAAAIRELLFGPEAGKLDPRGVWLRGARITGVLDLTDVRAVVPLVLHRCEFEEVLTGTRAHLPHLDLSASTLVGLDANDLVCEHDVGLDDIRSAGISLVDANITGDLSLRGARLVAGEVPALDIEGALIGGDLFLHRDFVAESHSRRGTLRLLGASVTGQLSLGGARLTASNGPALAADRATVGESFFLNERFTAESDSERGTLRLPGTGITGQVNLGGAHLRATNGPALHADRATVGNNLFLDEGFVAESDSQRGTLRLPGATVTGQLSLRGARLIANNGPDRASLGNNLFLNEGFVAESDSTEGTLRLPGATVTGQLSLGGRG
ncbi:hypothetical protein [Actinopolyspora mortivallis]|uniref:hypothetical protein n=1 Tax=Actinopolyspora mortivallis TaxID=33906 RepID=UPI00047E08E3|nr:hypothetical protein [Actinopolyspora mortivallis]